MTSIQDSGKTRLILDIPSSSGAGKRHTMIISIRTTIFTIMKMMMMMLVVVTLIIITVLV